MRAPPARRSQVTDDFVVTKASSGAHFDNIVGRTDSERGYPPDNDKIVGDASPRQNRGPRHAALAREFTQDAPVLSFTRR